MCPLGLWWCVGVERGKASWSSYITPAVLEPSQLFCGEFLQGKKFCTFLLCLKQNISRYYFDWHYLRTTLVGNCSKMAIIIFSKTLRFQRSENWIVCTLRFFIRLSSKKLQVRNMKFQTKMITLQNWKFPAPS